RDRDRKGCPWPWGSPLILEELVLGGLGLPSALGHHAMHGFYPEQVAHGSEAADHAHRDGGDERAMAEALACMNIRQVNLDRRSAAAGNGVPEGDRGMGIGAGIDHDTGSGRP